MKRSIAVLIVQGVGLAIVMWFILFLFLGTFAEGVDRLSPG